MDIREMVFGKITGNEIKGLLSRYRGTARLRYVVIYCTRGFYFLRIRSERMPAPIVRVRLDVHMYFFAGETTAHRFAGSTQSALSVREATVKGPTGNRPREGPAEEWWPPFGDFSPNRKTGSP